MTKRRQLKFNTLNEALSEANRLLESGYVAHGKWSLGQICRHLYLVQDGSVDGYPKWFSLFAFVRPVMRMTLLKRLLNGNSPAGIPTAPTFSPPNQLVDAAEITIFEASIERFQNHQGEFHPHPGFGKLPREQLEQLHAMHAAHHLGFLEPVTKPKLEQNDAQSEASTE